MTFSMRNKRPHLFTLIGLCCLSLSIRADEGLNQQANSRQVLIELNRSFTDPLRQAILSINQTPEFSILSRATDVLEKYQQQTPNDQVRKIYYGYAQLFQAGYYLRNKNYFRSAELSKRGFFFIDEAAESEMDNWRLRFLRLRMDAFVSADNGRCVIALKDATFLQQNKDIPQSLAPIITLAYARALTTCKKTELAKQTWQTLEGMGEMGKLMLQYQTRNIPFLTDIEMTQVLTPLLEGMQP